MHGKPEQNLNLLTAIRQRGLTQKAVARATGLSESKLSNILNGWIVPSAKEKKNLSFFLNEKPSKIFEEVMKKKITAKPC